MMLFDDDWCDDEGMNAHAVHTSAASWAAANNFFVAIPAADNSVSLLVVVVMVVESLIL